MKTPCRSMKTIVVLFSAVKKKKERNRNPRTGWLADNPPPVSSFKVGFDVAGCLLGSKRLEALLKAFSLGKKARFILSK